MKDSRVVNPQSFIFVDKPAGITTHSSLNESDREKPLTELNDGWGESLSSRFSKNLYVTHRLDRDTTGALCVAETPEAAAILQQLFADRLVEKRYLFLTDRLLDDSTDPARTEFEIESFIERTRDGFTSAQPSDANPVNAKTKMKLLAQDHGVALWEARPLTGKPHQIRLHAQEAGIAILGDTMHGGSPFPSLCLHSEELKFQIESQTYHYFSPAPLWFENRAFTQNSLLCRWMASVDRRIRLLRSWSQMGEDSNSEKNTLRWLHTESDPLRAEQLGDVHWLSWFDEELTDEEWNLIQSFCETVGWQNWYLQLRGNRGKSPTDETIRLGSNNLPQRWIAQENQINFEFRRDSGLSPGLFLDQRQNRKWVKENSSGKKILNLFCYTGGFSVCAAKGGAAKVVSVDVSKTFLEWAKRNFELNELSLENHEFRAMDSRSYLSWAKKKDLKFDLIICDPPSFGRSKEGVFRIEKDFPELLSSLLSVTAPGGRILFSANFEKWSIDEFATRTLSHLSSLRVRTEITRTPTPDWDFELPRQERNMKSFFITLL